MSASACARAVVSLVRALERGTLATSAAFLTGEREREREREREMGAAGGGKARRGDLIRWSVKKKNNIRAVW